MYKIDSSFGVGRSIPDFDQEIVKNEPMFFNCDIDYCHNNGGPITKAFLEAIAMSARDIPLSELVIDSRVHMLMKGWFPCIPGFHHDDVPRSGSGGQPNYDDPEYRSQHVFALVNGDICPTEFAVGRFECSVVSPSEVIYKKWHEEVEDQLSRGIGKRTSVPSNRLVFFDDRAFHQGTRAVDGGWRWFARASWDTHRKPTNEIRRQVQVYLEHPMEGW